MNVLLDCWPLLLIPGVFLLRAIGAWMYQEPAVSEPRCATCACALLRCLDCGVMTCLCLDRSVCRCPPPPAVLALLPLSACHCGCHQPGEARWCGCCTVAE